MESDQEYMLYLFLKRWLEFLEEFPCVFYVTVVKEWRELVCPILYALGLIVLGMTRLNLLDLIKLIKSLQTRNNLFQIIFVCIVVYVFNLLLIFFDVAVGRPKTLMRHLRYVMSFVLNFFT